LKEVSRAAQVRAFQAEHHQVDRGPRVGAYLLCPRSCKGGRVLGWNERGERSYKMGLGGSLIWLEFIGCCKIALSMFELQSDRIRCTFS